MYSANLISQLDLSLKQKKSKVKINRSLIILQFREFSYWNAELNTSKHELGHSHSSLSFSHNFISISGEKKKKLLTSDIERAGVFALFFFPVTFCFIKYRINFIKSVSIVELPAGINMKKLQQQFVSSSKLKSSAVYKIILTASLVRFTDGSILVWKIRNLGHLW